MTARTVLLAALAVIPLPVAAQAPARVIGRVVDASTGAPLGSADVRLGEQRATTASDGAFVLVAVTTGRGTLAVRRIGYAPWVGVVDVVPGLDRTITVELAPMPLRLDSLTVVATPGTLSISRSAER